MFLPYLPVTVTDLLSLIAEADTMETKRRVLGTLNVVIERAEANVSRLCGVRVRQTQNLSTDCALARRYSSSAASTL